MPSFVRSIVVKAPVAHVFAFHERDDALPRLSPPFPPVRVVRREGGIRPGARVDLRIGPIRWLALHTAYEQDHLLSRLQEQRRRLGLDSAKEVILLNWDRFQPLVRAAVGNPSVPCLLRKLLY